MEFAVVLIGIYIGAFYAAGAAEERAMYPALAAITGAMYVFME